MAENRWKEERAAVAARANQRNRGWEREECDALGDRGLCLLFLVAVFLGGGDDGGDGDDVVTGATLFVDDAISLVLSLVLGARAFFFHDGSQSPGKDNVAEQLSSLLILLLLFSWCDLVRSFSVGSFTVCLSDKMAVGGE